MKVKEIKETVEKVVATKYIAEDGRVFCDEEECRKYEESNRPNKAIKRKRHNVL